ncbi:D(2) dopamine receptor [Biomphalaria glabrata]|nr:D(2) dopamine receptor [Biomphalaria glabrata]
MTNSFILQSRNYSEVRNEPTVPYCNQETIQKSEMNQQFRTAIKKLFRSQKRTNSSVLHSRNYSEVRNEPTVPYCNQETIQKSEMTNSFILQSRNYSEVRNETFL